MWPHGQNFAKIGEILPEISVATLSKQNQVERISKAETEEPSRHQKQEREKRGVGGREGDAPNHRIFFLISERLPPPSPVPNGFFLCYLVRPLINVIDVSMPPKETAKVIIV